MELSSPCLHSMFLAWSSCITNEGKDRHGLLSFRKSLEKENSFLSTRGECHCDSKTLVTHIDYCDLLASVWMQESLKGDDCLI
jgi:hypothetical protein